MPTNRSSTRPYETANIPTSRIRPILAEFVRIHGTKDLCNATGLNERRIYALLHEQENVTFNIVDQLLTKMGRVDVWYSELEDLYELA